MDIVEYQDKIIELFKSGRATKEQWIEMAGAVLVMSENDGGKVFEIDKAIYPKSIIEREIDNG